MSCEYVLMTEVAHVESQDPLTNDLRYESNDSREMLNCSFSSNAHRCNDEDVVDRDAVVPQKFFFSVGEGGKYTPESLISATAVVSS